MVVELDKCQILKEQIKLYEQSNTELQKTIILLKEINDKKSEIIANNENIISMYKTSLADQEKIYKEQLKNAKPSFKEEVMKATIYIVIGAIFGILI